jgi:serine/threonine protein kinase
MTFENEDILPKFIKEHSTSLPIQCKVDTDTNRTVYRCHNDFGPLDWRELRKMIPKIADFGLASRLDSDLPGGEMEKGEEVGIYPIQPDHYRAPEVVLGCGWGFSADIWNLGVLGRKNL